MTVRLYSEMEILTMSNVDPTSPSNWVRYTDYQEVQTKLAASEALYRAAVAERDSYKRLAKDMEACEIRVRSDLAAANAELAYANQQGNQCIIDLATAKLEAINAYARVAELEALREAIDSCKSDTWQCPKCGHAESWWDGSNAQHFWDKAALASPAKAIAVCDNCGKELRDHIKPLMTCHPESPAKEPNA